MTKKKHTKRAAKGKASTPRAAGWVEKKSGATDAPLSALPAQRATEKALMDARRALEEQEFSSIEEANEFLQELLASGGGQFPVHEASTDLERAQDIMYEAWGATSKKKRVDLAKRALATSADCADAYVLLAQETAKSKRQVVELYEQGVQAGERALGPEYFEEQAGYFWGLVETRPYMRARAGFTAALWKMGERRAALEQARELLRLNPGDNQGTRYILLQWLLIEGMDDEASALLKEYEDDGAAAWLYGRTFHEFRTRGRSAKADAALREALEENRHVQPYLLGEKELPMHVPDLIEWGGESEAVEYVYAAYGLWYYTPGALEWVRSVRDADAGGGEKGEGG